MQPLKIGACLKAAEIAEHRNWLFDDARDIEIQDFMTQASLSADRADRHNRTRWSYRAPRHPRAV